jgi:hypothetical protein
MMTTTPRAHARCQIDSFLLSLEAKSFAPQTGRGYGESVELLGRFLAARGIPRATKLNGGASG